MKKIDMEKFEGRYICVDLSNGKCLCGKVTGLSDEVVELSSNRYGITVVSLDIIITIRKSNTEEF